MCVVCAVLIFPLVNKIEASNIVKTSNNYVISPFPGKARNKSKQHRTNSTSSNPNLFDRELIPVIIILTPTTIKEYCMYYQNLARHGKHKGDFV